MSLNISLEATDGSITIFLGGDLDAIGSDRFEAGLAKTFETDCPLIIIDMSKLDFIASHGIGILVSAYKKLLTVGRKMKIVNVSHEIRKIFLMMGLDRLLPIDIPEDSQDGEKNSDDKQALRTAHEFLLELFENLKIDPQVAHTKLDEIFSLCSTVSPNEQYTTRIKELLGDLDLPTRISKVSSDRPKILHDRINPYMSASTSLLHIRCGNARVAETFADSQRVQLVDIVNRNETALPLAIYDGTILSFDDKSFDTTLMINVLSHSKSPIDSLREAIRVTRNRIIIKETVYFNEAQRFFCEFMDWFYTCVIGDGSINHSNFKTHKEWAEMGRGEKLQLKADIDIGLDQIAIPEYHWMYVFDIPGN
jgi:anti-anti-sigma factor